MVSSEPWRGGQKDGLGPDDEIAHTLDQEIRILLFNPLVLKF